MPLSRMSEVCLRTSNHYHYIILLYYTAFINFHFSVFYFAGSHSRSFGQMDANRRRDLGQSHSARKKPPGGQSVRPCADTHGKRVR